MFATRAAVLYRIDDHEPIAIDYILHKYNTKARTDEINRLIWQLVTTN